MSKIYVPSGGPQDWQGLLAEPDRHWRDGFSAKMLAETWEAANDLPPEIIALLQSHPDFQERPELLIALPEWKVPLPGGRRESQNDVFVLLRSGQRTVAMTVEGKVNEPFGPTIGEWLSETTDGKKQRLSAIKDLLALASNIPGTIRYQLLHRAASAVIEAHRFGTSAAAMIIHSFSPNDLWFADFDAFCGLYGKKAEFGAVVELRTNGITLYVGWARGRHPLPVSQPA